MGRDHFEDRLLALHEVANELSLAHSVSNLCRRAVELGRGFLGFDRISIWFIDKDPEYIIGSFGIDEKGRLRDETDERVAIGKDHSLVSLREGKTRSILETGVELRNNSSQVVGEGSRMIASIWNGRATIGYVFRDNLIKHEEITPHDRELLELFASTVGHLHTLRQSEEKLKAAYDELKETQYQLIHAAKMDVVGNLASGVAHEVKNPLAIIQQGVDYISSRIKQNDENVLLTIQRINGAIKRADGIIKGLLDFSSISKMECSYQDLNALLFDSLQLVHHALDKHHIIVRKNFEKNLPQVNVDRNKIEQVFVNLFLNSISHMKSGGELSIKTYFGFSGDRKKKVFVDIEDTGTGIPSNVLDKIFDPFFTTRRGEGGTGLGLAIVKTILDMHDAKIGIVNNEEGRGVKAVLSFDT